jgi:predicted Zn-ribbon and HTH transcriptional regulator
MKLLISSRQRCVVCGYSEMRMDEVVDRGLVYLAECPRCESRWTSRQPSAVARVEAPASSMRSVTRPVPEIAPAA